MKTITIVMCIAIALLFTNVVQADSMRCGTFVIEDGGLQNVITLEEVVKKCGKPSSREGNILYYKEKGKKLNFDDNNRLMEISAIEF